MSGRSDDRTANPTMKQRAREAASTALLEAAEHVASERGIEQTSIAAIAERAQVAVGTLYNYFPDRESLLSALFKWRRDEMIPRLVAAAAMAGEDGPFEQRLRAYILHTARAFDGFRRFCRVAMSADQSGTQIKGRVTGNKSIVLETFLNSLIRILQPVYGAKSEEYARMMFGAFKMMMQFQLERDQPIENLVDSLVTTFLQGMAV
ncbi:MAG: helix-turn-helix domain-containing protein [Kofleriaceae bacterium]